MKLMSETVRPKRVRALSGPSPKWMTFQEIASHFRVSEATVRLGRGAFGRLRRVTITEGRTVVPRADFERLDRDMERAAVMLEATGID